MWVHKSRSDHAAVAEHNLKAAECLKVELANGVNSRQAVGYRIC